jgi:hypothetical protein
LTVSIVFFLLGQTFLNWNEDFTDFVEGVNSSYSYEKNSLKDKENIAILIAQRDSLNAQGNIAGSVAINNVIERMEKVAKDTLKTTTYLTEKELDQKNFIWHYLEQTAEYKEHAKLNPSMSVQEALQDIGHGNSDLNNSRYKKANRFNDLESRPYQMVEMVVPKTPLFLFFFAPIISLFLWLIYVRHPFNFMEHLVFTFHIFTFFFLSLFVLIGIVGISFGRISWEIPALLILGIAGPFYFYKAMRRFYRQGRFKTIIKFLFINFVFFLLFFTSAAIFIVGSVFIGA